MPDPTPIATRAAKEADAVWALLRSRPILFTGLCFVAIAFFAMWIYEKLWGKETLKATVASQGQQILLLEAQLTPFKTIALQRYPGELSEALAALASDIKQFEARLNETQRELDATKQRASQIDERTRGRSLSEAQKQRMREFLAASAKGKVRMNAVGSDLEAVAFMKDVQDALISAGESVEADVAMMIMGRDGVPKGITIRVKNGSDPPLHATAIARAFLDLGIRPRMEIDPGIDSSEVVITIGAKEPVR